MTCRKNEKWRWPSENPQLRHSSTRSVGCRAVFCHLLKWLACNELISGTSDTLINYFTRLRLKGKTGRIMIPNMQPSGCHAGTAHTHNPVWGMNPYPTLLDKRLANRFSKTTKNVCTYRHEGPFACVGGWTLNSNKLRCNPRQAASSPTALAM